MYRIQVGGQILYILFFPFPGNGQTGTYIMVKIWPGAVAHINTMLTVTATMTPTLVQWHIFLIWWEDA